MIIYEDIFKEFQKQKVKYVLVGGLAVNLLGSLRSTADMDIVVEMSDENLVKVITILTKRGYKIRQPIDPMGIADKKTRQYWVKTKNMKALNFYKENGLEQVDIVIDSPVTFEDAEKSCEQIKCDDIILPVVSVKNLIKMKKNTGRGMDKLDIEELKKIKRLKKNK